MKTLDQIFEERKLVKGTDFYDAAFEYGEQYRRLVKHVAEDRGNIGRLFLLQESILKKMIRQIPDYAINQLVKGLTPDETKFLHDIDPYSVTGWESSVLLDKLRQSDEKEEM